MLLVDFGQSGFTDKLALQLTLLRRSPRSHHTEAGGCHEAKNQSLFIAYSNDLGVTLGVTNQEGLVLHVTHRCVKLLHTRISWCHIWPLPLCVL